MGAGFLFTVLFLYNYFYSRNIVSDLIYRDAYHLSLAMVRKIENTLDRLEIVAKGAALRLMEEGLEKGDVAVIPEMLQNNAELFGSTVALEPSADYVITGKDLEAPYWYMGTSGLKFRYLSYDYTTSDWYLIPKLLGRSEWSEPYFDVGGGEVLMVTFSQPLYRMLQGKKEFAGVMTVDVSLAWLGGLLSSLGIGKTGYAFILSRTGTFIAHPDERLVMNETIFSIAEELKNPALRELGKRMIRGEEGVEEVKDPETKADSWMVFQPLSDVGWSLGIVVPKKELLEQLTKLSRMVALLGIAGLVALIVVVAWIGETITRPIRELTASVDQIGQGNLDTLLPSLSSRDEVAVLAHAFARMQSSLKHYIDELARTISEKQRIESELAIAREIQLGILPKVFPPFPERTDFDIHACLSPAREVGGDFYDFFFTEQDRFWVVIADVSGKGVPASLFMAVTKTLIKAKVERSSSPAEVLTTVNRDLSSDNPSVMFVTVFLGVLDTRTGIFTYANGGHNPPYLVRENEGLVVLQAPKSLALGVFGEISYRESSIALTKTDTLLFYTDGVTEALSPEGQFFTAQRLEESLKGVGNSSPKEIVETLKRQIQEFVAEAPQADDITIMALRFHGVTEKDLT